MRALVTSTEQAEVELGLGTDLSHPSSAHLHIIRGATAEINAQNDD
jgi:hypothetical protein